MISYRNQKVFNIAVMRFINNMIYVQKQINNHLQSFKKFIRIYINNIIIFSRTFQDHLQHFKKMFIFLKKLHIILNLKKSYFEFLIINLFDQKVSSLELIIIQNKIKIIVKLKFLKNFYNLEIYLEFIS